MAKKIIIPKSFELGPYKIVNNPESNLCYREGAQGKAYLNSCEIGLQTKEVGAPFSDRQILQTYCHEKAHWFTFMLKRMDLCDDENFIDLLGDLIAQYEISKKGTSITLNI